MCYVEGGEISLYLYPCEVIVVHYDDDYLSVYQNLYSFSSVAPFHAESVLCTYTCSIIASP